MRPYRIARPNSLEWKPAFRSSRRGAYFVVFSSCCFLFSSQGQLISSDATVLKLLPRSTNLASILFARLTNVWSARLGHPSMLLPGYFHLSALVVPVKTRGGWLPPSCEPSPPLGRRSLAQHCVLQDILFALDLVRCTPTAHLQRILDLCRIICTLRPAPCSFWSFLCSRSIRVRVVGTIYGFLSPCVLGKSSIPTSRQKQSLTRSS